MAKAILRLGYTDYVMDADKALAIAEIISKSEIYEQKYVKGNTTSYHIYDNTAVDNGVLRLISDSFYQMAKLAGRPAEDK